MGAGPGNNQGWVDQGEQKLNGTGAVEQHGDVIAVADSTRLAISLHCINGPASGTTTITIQESPDYGTVAKGQEHWMTLKAFTALDSTKDDTWQKIQVPDGTIYTFFSHIRVVATNSEDDQTCLFSIMISQY